MANTTVTGALAIHGKNPQFLVETVIRNRIYESAYWKEHCFALTAESLIDNAIQLTYVGGVYANQRPTSFICLLLKLLQIQPEKEILVEYLRAEEFKQVLAFPARTPPTYLTHRYLRALAALYIRLTFPPVDVYELLEPMLKDYSKLRARDVGGYSLTFMDEYVHSLLTEERVCDIILPRLPKRQVLEENGDLGPRKSRLLDAMQANSDAGSQPRSPSRSLSSRSRSSSDAASRYRSRSPSRSRSTSPFRSRSRSISPDRFQLDQP